MTNNTMMPVLDGFQAIEDAKADDLSAKHGHMKHHWILRGAGLDKGVQVHTLDRKLLDVVVLRVLRRVPDQPQLQPVKEVVACQRRNAHVEEHALQHRTRQELQGRCQEQRAPDQNVDDEVRGSLLHHLHRHFAFAFGKLLHIVRGQRDHMGDARHSRGH